VLTQLAAFVAVSAVVICTPGQDTALTIRNALLGGRRSGVATAAGVAGGQAVWTVAASAGLAAVLSASQPAFLALKLAGAAYLVFLGLQSLRAACSRAPRGEAFAAPRLGLAPARALRQGLLSNLANPKMAVFFTSLLPQFAPTGGGAFAALLLLGFLFCALTFVWLAAYSFAVAKAHRILVRGPIRRALDALTGMVLVALGVRLAAAQR
jgi:threonine/homoserine/homoserine lactone efflux protein